MSTITPQHIAGGAVPTLQAALAAGDTYPSASNPILEVVNSGPVPILLTLAAINNCSQGFKHPLTFTVAGLATRPFQISAPAVAFYSDGSANVEVAYSTTLQPAPGQPSGWALAGIGPGVGTYRYAVTLVNGTGETSGGTEVSVTTTSGNQVLQLQNLPLGPGGTTARKVYRTALNGASGSEKLLVTISDNTTTSYQDSIPDSSLGAAIPTSNTAGVPAPGAAAAATATGSTLGVGVYLYQVTFTNAQGETIGGREFTITTTTGNTNVSLTSVPLGPSGTVSRKIYRTAVGGASGTEKLVTTLADNTTTTYTDSTADGSLGAAIPGTNTANCVQVAVTIA